MSRDLSLKETENQAAHRFYFDLASTAGSFLLPGLLPLYTLADSSFRVASEGSTFSEESPRLTFGLLTTLPSYASGTFLSALYSKRIFNGLKRLIGTQGFQTLYRLSTHQWFSRTLLLCSFLGSALHFRENLEVYENGEIDGATVAYRTASSLLMLGGGFLFSCHRPNPSDHRTVHPKRDEITIDLANPRKTTYRGGIGSKLKGLRRLLFYSAPRTLAGYHIKTGDFQRASTEQLGLDSWILRQTGVHRVVIRGGEHLKGATAAGAPAMTLQLTHYDLRDWALTDFTSRHLGRDQGQFMRASLGKLGPLSMLTSAEMGSHLVLIDRHNISMGVFQMQRGFRPSYPARNGNIHYVIYGPQTRTTGKNYMKERGGLLVQRNEAGELEPTVVSSFGEDDFKRLWRPHTTPFEFALTHERAFGDNLHIIPSVIIPSDFQNGAYRTLTVEYFEPIPVKRYLEIMRDKTHRLSLKEGAELMRNAMVDWMIKNLVRDGYFSSYAHAYYPIQQSGVLR
ncbi:MAG: hypothetical protein HY539_03695, partial [Deltaproteobacteria bacterium]|nr:hypothetical protein [Deltaproteobacteria bacterium]